MIRGILTRARPFAEVGLWIVGAIVALNLVLLGLQNAALLTWLPDRSAGIGYILESRSRVAGAIASYRTGKVLPDRPLAAVIGISDVREGIRLDVLSAAMHERWRFVGVAGAGAGMSSVAEQAAILTDSDLRPDVAILGLSPLHFIDVRQLRQGDATAARSISARDRAKDALRQVAWVVRRRSDIARWFDTVLIDARTMLGSASGDPNSGSLSDSPWRPMMRTLGAEHYPPDVLQKSLEKLRASGGGQAETVKLTLGEVRHQIGAQNALHPILVDGSQTGFQFRPCFVELGCDHFVRHFGRQSLIIGRNGKPDEPSCHPLKPWHQAPHGHQGSVLGPL